jgi:SAM-dependent methyltransferase
MIKDWIAFWDSPHSIYVNPRHKNVHYRLVAQQIAALVPGGGQAVVLDYGCGEALHADLVSAVAAEVLLCEAAAGVRAGLEKRFAEDPKIRVVAPHEAARLPDQTCDVIVLHSVVQYLTPAGAGALLALFRRLIKPGGLLVVSDVIQPNVAAAADAIALLRFGKANGFFFAAWWGLIRTFFSDYWRLRGQLGLTRYSEAQMTEKLAGAGFAAERAPKNIGHNQARMAFYARPR